LHSYKSGYRCCPYDFNKGIMSFVSPGQAASLVVEKDIEVKQSGIEPNENFNESTCCKRPIIAITDKRSIIRNDSKPKKSYHHLNHYPTRHSKYIHTMKVPNRLIKSYQL
jgi:hypothetical protein